MDKLFGTVIFMGVVEFRYGSVVADLIFASLRAGSGKTAFRQFLSIVEGNIESQGCGRAGRKRSCFSIYPFREGGTLAFHLEVEFREMERRAWSM